MVAQAGSFAEGLWKASEAFDVSVVDLSPAPSAGADRVVSRDVTLEEIIVALELLTVEGTVFLLRE